MNFKLYITKEVSLLYIVWPSVKSIGLKTFELKRPVLPNVLNIMSLDNFKAKTENFLLHRKNRNMYAQVLLSMLKRDLIEEPFSQQPESGPLPTMPAYMVRYVKD